MRWAILLLAAFFFIAGCSQQSHLGLKSVEDCEQEIPVGYNSMKVQCYHAAGITAAYLGNPEEARNICDRIWTRFGGSVDRDGSDIRKKAEMVSNSCFYDVAKITRDPGICAWITQHDDYGSALFGDRVTKETCIDEVGRLAMLAPENYYTSNPNNICAIIFVLPLMVVGAVVFGNKRRTG
ncbi:MAG TPA: hypothetical protein VLD37_07230 [Candidatus Bilamarchaeum sp.]|nr:hypothetical protein [Candidatus Bilamarchaeum sp.]